MRQGVVWLLGVFVGWLGLSVQAATLPVCHAIYDAGSSGTRLYLYTAEGDGWQAHVGPKVGALADPVRAMRGKTLADMATVTTDIVQALAQVVQDGPAAVAGQPLWRGYDWRKRCRLVSVRVLATAGMRMAEQENAEQSRVLWQMLRQKLRQALPSSVAVQARTLSGYEEGLFTWLAVQAQTRRVDFGIVEMGGASSQIVFPCQGCDRTDDAVHTVRIGGQWRRMYSYSFLGLGQDEAPRALGVSAACAYGVGEQQPTWTPADCTKEIPLRTETGALRDPYNYTAGHQGAVRKVPVEHRDAVDWVLTGAFNYLDHADIERLCLGKGGYFGEEKAACFRPVYLEMYLQALQVPISSPRSDVSWTLGAQVCHATRCLPRRPVPVCRWRAQGCLD